MENKCPFCNHNEEPDIPKQFICGTYWARFLKEHVQSAICMKFQIRNLKSLVKEIVPYLEQFRSAIQQDYHTKTPRLDEIIDRPAVKEIMEGK